MCVCGGGRTYICNTNDCIVDLEQNISLESNGRDSSVHKCVWVGGVGVGKGGWVHT